MQVAAEFCSTLQLPLTVLTVNKDEEQGRKVLDEAEALSEPLRPEGRVRAAADRQRAGAHRQLHPRARSRPALHRRLRPQPHHRDGAGQHDRVRAAQRRLPGLPEPLSRRRRPVRAGTCRLTSPSPKTSGRAPLGFRARAAPVRSSPALSDPAGADLPDRVAVARRSGRAPRRQPRPVAVAPFPAPRAPAGGPSLRSFRPCSGSAPATWHWRRGFVAGIGLALAALAGLRPRLCFLLSTLLYLSYATAGRTFLSFQWDNLLLECGILAVFLPTDRPARWIHLLFRLLLFKLYWESGVAKMAIVHRRLARRQRDDLLLRDGTAADLARAVRARPSRLVAPFREPRRPGARAARPGRILRTAARPPGRLCPPHGLSGRQHRHRQLRLLLLPRPRPARLPARRPGPRADRPMAPVAPRAAAPRPTGTAAGGRGVAAHRRAPPSSSPSSSPCPCSTACWPSAAEARGGRPWSRCGRSTSPGGLVNTYHLFGQITRERIEPEFQTSSGGAWTAHDFRYKPGYPRRAPRFVAPHQPRVDFQLWFYGLGYRRVRRLRRRPRASPVPGPRGGPGPLPGSASTAPRGGAHRVLAVSLHDAVGAREQRHWWTRRRVDSTRSIACDGLRS